MGYEYPLLRQIIGKNKRSLSDKQMFRQQIKNTEHFYECKNCGDTWSLDEGEDCDWCDNQNTTITTTEGNNQ